MEDLTGKKYSKLTVIKFSGKRESHAKWLCLCECGKKTIVDGWKLKSGHTKSCGCLKMKGNHSRTYRRLNQIWRDMKSRCKNSNYKNYHRYGGRGIKVCDEWDKNFKEFYNWSLNNGYSDNLTIDRIDVNGNYEPSNCRWATKITQANNRDNNRIIEFEGEAHTLTEWSRIKGLGFKTLDYRLKAGWQLEKVFNKPLDIKCSHKKEDLKEDK